MIKVPGIKGSRNKRCTRKINAEQIIISESRIKKKPANGFEWT